MNGNAIRIDVIGNSFEPKINMSQFEGEETLSLVFKGGGFFRKHKLVDNKIVIENKNVKLELYTEGENFKFVVYLLKKPPVNYYECKLSGHENFDFLYQPELTTQEIANGDIRPDDVIGSYAVYHKTKCNNKYKTGKAYHIYRPKAVDSKGITDWAVLKISNEVYRVELSQAYLDKATYPVRINDTFGKTDVGGSAGSFDTSGDYMVWESPDTPGSDGTLNYMTMYLNPPSNTTMKYGLYDESGGNPNSLLDTDASAFTATSGTGWKQNSVDYNYSITSGVQYWFAALSIEHYVIPYWYDSGGERYYNSGSYTSLPATAGTNNQSARRVSFYATYTTGGAAAPAATAQPQIIICE